MHRVKLECADWSVQIFDEIIKMVVSLGLISIETFKYVVILICFNILAGLKGDQGEPGRGQPGAPGIHGRTGIPGTPGLQGE